ncbi:MAG: Fic family protein [Limisphaerales bacterium]
MRDRAAKYMLLRHGSKTPEIVRAVRANRMRKIASKIYTDDLTSPPEEIVRRHRLEIAAHFYPGALISHRSALEGGNISPGGKLHLTVPQAVATVRKLPGLEIRLWRGPAPQANDIRNPLGDGKELFTSSQARAILENMQIARAHGGDEAKTLSAGELERWIDRYLRIFGVAWLDKLREQANDLASRFGWLREQQELNQLVAAIKGETSNYRLTTDLVRSRAQGKPYDPERVTLFGTLQARLAAEHFVELPRPPANELENRAFWEAYFSNFIEGTKFTVEEARVIVYDREAAKALERKRPDDAHDILETYRLIIDPKISGEVPKDAAQLLELLKRRHARMMASRLNIEPGVFKTTNNQLGSRVFVAPELVAETLTRGWPASRELPSASARALYVLFLIAEVHPFNDGNGRISRLGMNAEFCRAESAAQ